MQEHILNKSNPFIRGYYMDPEVCDHILAEIKDSEDMFRPGMDYYTQIAVEQLSTVNRNAYVDSLFEVIEEYKKEFNFSYEFLERWGLCPGIKIQKYKPGEHYANWHCEAAGGDDGSGFHRHLVYMTYLHDIADEGGTEFYYQNIKVKPEKGLTLIWPADWTHHHRGIVSMTEEKNIITGWWVFYNNPRG